MTTELVTVTKINFLFDNVDDDLRLMNYPTYTHILTENDGQGRGLYVPETSSGTMTTVTRRKGRLKTHVQTRVDIPARPSVGPIVVPPSQSKPTDSLTRPSSPALQSFASSDYDVFPSSDFGSDFTDDFFPSFNAEDNHTSSAVEPPHKRIRVSGDYCYGSLLTLRPIDISIRCMDSSPARIRRRDALSRCSWHTGR